MLGRLSSGVLNDHRVSHRLLPVVGQTAERLGFVLVLNRRGTA